MAEYTKDQLINAGGKLWEKNDKHRVYFNNIATLYGLDLGFYNTGNISSAQLDGEKISNTQARKILVDLDSGKFFFDLDDKKFHWTGIDPADINRLVKSITKKIG